MPKTTLVQFNLMARTMKVVRNADDLILMAKIMEKLEAQFIRLRVIIKGKGLNVYLVKTKVMECGGSGVFVLAKINFRGVWGKRTNVNYERCMTCKKWVHARYASVFYVMWQKKHMDYQRTNL